MLSSRSKIKQIAINNPIFQYPASRLSKELTRSIDIHAQNYRGREIPINIAHTNFMTHFTSEPNPSLQMTLSPNGKQKLRRSVG